MYHHTDSSTGHSTAEYAALPGQFPTEDDLYNQTRTLQASRRRWMVLALVELVILLVTQWAAMFSTNRLTTPYSLVEDVIRYETHVFHTGYPGDSTEYIAPPSPKVDSLWDDLIKGGIFKITKEEERALGNRTFPLPENEGHFASSLAVVHHLHCLNNMRKSLWPEHYPEFDVQSNMKALIHQKHCIEILRQAHMCHPDLTAEVLQWDVGQQKVIIPADRQHTCVDFNSIQQWMRKRTVYDDEFDRYLYVEGGPVYKPAHATSN